MHQKIQAALDELDAALFNGDTFDMGAPDGIEHREQLKLYLARWAAHLAEDDPPAQPVATTRALAAFGRKPTLEDFDAWKVMLLDQSDDIDGGDDIDWNDMALGFLVARGVDYGFTGWELLSAFTCGDRPRAKAAIREIDNMTKPDRAEHEDDDDDDDD